MPGKKSADKKRVSLGASATVFSIIAAAAVIFAIYISGLRNSVISNASVYIENTVSISSEFCRQYFESMTGVLEHCAGEIKNFDDSERITERISHYCTDHSFARIAFVSMQGDTVTSDGRELEASIRVLAHEAASQKKNFMYANSETISNYDLYAVPVTGDDGEARGALIGGVRPLELSDIIFSGDSGYSGDYFVVNDKGTVLFAESGAELFGIGASAVDILENEGNDVNSFKASLNQKNVNGTKEVKLNGGDYILAYSSVNQELTVLLLTPVEPVIAATRLLYMPSIVFIIALAVIIVFITVYALNLTHRLRSNADEALEDSRRMYYEDSVTGYGTWYKFIQDYDRQVKDTSHNQALISLDIDKFKATNDLIGYDGGNAVLKQLADIIAGNIGKNDLFARASGDKFFILAGYDDSSELNDLVDRIIADAGYQITSVKIAVSMGVYPISDRTISAHTAADRADLARIRAKKDKDCSYLFFDSSMLESIRSEHFIETVMETALEKKEFLVYLQPKFGLGNRNDVTGAEALVRWRHNGEIVPPGEFIPLFERNGFVTKLDFYMFREVCRLQKTWLSHGYEPKIISVNMSRAHLNNPDFVSELSACCKEFNIDPKYFEIEITESAAYENLDILMKVFVQIREAGFHVSIDDFGSGYSSLNMLKDLPVDVLKIDRSFLTENADESENASKIIGCVVSLATSLNISTICEGIETKEQAMLLTKLGCDMAQGFFFARPMPVSEYEKLVYHTDTIQALPDSSGKSGKK